MLEQFVWITKTARSLFTNTLSLLSSQLETLVTEMLQNQQYESKKTQPDFFNKEEYMHFLEKAQQDNLKIIYVRNFTNGNYSKFGGLTAVVGRSFSRGKAAKMSVAICSPADIFVKRYGAFLALKSYYEGKCIPITCKDSPSKTATTMLTSMLDV
jgi:hypothetical protein